MAARGVGRRRFAPAGALRAEPWAQARLCCHLVGREPAGGRALRRRVAGAAWRLEQRARLTGLFFGTVTPLRAEAGGARLRQPLTSAAVCRCTSARASVRDGPCGHARARLARHRPPSLAGRQKQHACRRTARAVFTKRPEHVRTKAASQRVCLKRLCPRAIPCAGATWWSGPSSAEAASSTWPRQSTACGRPWRQRTSSSSTPRRPPSRPARWPRRAPPWRAACRTCPVSRAAPSHASARASRAHAGGSWRAGFVHALRLRSHCACADADRTLVGVATFDSAVHFYSLRAGASQAQMLVVGDVHEVREVPQLLLRWQMCKRASWARLAPRRVLHLAID